MEYLSANMLCGLQNGPDYHHGHSHLRLCVDGFGWMSAWTRVFMCAFMCVRIIHENMNGLPQDHAELPDVAARH